VTWGTSPEDVLPITGVVPDPDDFADAASAPPMPSARSTIWA
jgi:3-isopropylmalate/(R)-2-methylmalate dehydratase large subunit